MQFKEWLGSNFLYHGSSVHGLRILLPRMRTKRFDQNQPRVYACRTKEEAAIFGCPFDDSNSSISWHNSKMVVRINDTSLMRKYRVSIYSVDLNNFQSLEDIEWFSERSVRVLNEEIVNDAIGYAEKQGVIISLNESIIVTSWSSEGLVSFSINGKKYKYLTNDGAIAKKIYELGRHEPGRALQIAKNYSLVTNSLVER